MDGLRFDKNRNRVKYCPCNKSNSDGKFAPFQGFFNKGFCHSCGETFLPDKDYSIIVKPFLSEQEKPISYHDRGLLEQSQRNFNNNNFVLFLLSLFDREMVYKVIAKYKIGTSNYFKGATIFWQIDANQNVRHGKIILYAVNSGKKLKFNSVRSVLKLEDFNLKQCLFGLHLLEGIKQKTIALVESEKTAILMSLFKPEYTWMATGGLSEFKLDKLKPLKPFKIVAFPDKGKFNNWFEKAKEFKKWGYNITIDNWLETQNVPEETDLADILIQIKKTNTP